MNDIRSHATGENIQCVGAPGEQKWARTITVESESQRRARAGGNVETGIRVAFGVGDQLDG